MAADTLAQQEFNELMRDKSTLKTHPSDSDDARSFLNLSEDEDEKAGLRRLGDARRSPRSYNVDDDEPDDDGEPPVRQSMTQTRHIIPRKRYGANTGPKGVISDAQNYRDSERQRRKSSRTPPSVAAPNGVHSSNLSRGRTTFVNDDSDDSDIEHLDAGDGDGTFIAQWRDSRLKELRNGAFQSATHNRERIQARSWRGMTTVDAEGYLDAVDRTPAKAVVAVYIYDDSSEVSLAFDDCLRAIARQHGGTRFIRLHHTEAEMDSAGVPALIAYRGGDKFVGLVPLAHELPDATELTAAALEAVLKRHAII